MGNTSPSSHVANAHPSALRMVFTDDNKAESEFHLTRGEYRGLRTPGGRVHLKVYAPGEDDYPAAQLALNADDSFIVKQSAGKIAIVRARYGSVWQEHDGAAWR